MIRSEAEYRQAVRTLGDQERRLEEQQARLEQMGLKPAEMKRVMDPMQSFHQQLAEEVASYERLKRGEFDEIHSLRGIGELLIATRIYRGLTQRELAQRLGVHESQISRDERNEYHNITLERAARILELLGIELCSRVEQVRQQIAV